MKPIGGDPLPSWHGPGRPDLEQRARAAIELHLDDPGLSIASLARELMLSRSQLYRRLKQEAGCTPSELVRALRLERAAQMLALRAGSVSAVAGAAGFKSLAHFSRSFHSHFGLTPSEFAARPRGDPGQPSSLPVPADSIRAHTTTPLDAPARSPLQETES
jgi:AraC-like DNA-binding protein